MIKFYLATYNNSNTMTDTIINQIKKALDGKSTIDNDVNKFIREFDFTQLINNTKFVQKKYVKDHLIKEDNYSMYAIYWGDSSYCYPHNHPDGGCILRIVSGKVLEKNYELVDGEAKFTNERYLIKDNVCIKYGNQLHSMTPQENTFGIHVYFPGDYKPKYFDICK